MLRVGHLLRAGGLATLSSKAPASAVHARADRLDHAQILRVGSTSLISTDAPEQAMVDFPADVRRIYARDIAARTPATGESLPDPMQTAIIRHLHQAAGMGSSVRASPLLPRPAFAPAAGFFSQAAGGGSDGSSPNGSGPRSGGAFAPKPASGSKAPASGSSVVPGGPLSSGVGRHGWGGEHLRQPHSQQYAPQASGAGVGYAPTTFVSSHVKLNRGDVVDYLTRKGLIFKELIDRVSVLDCPFCKPTRNQPDNQWKLAIFDNGGFQCLRCGSHGSWYDFKNRFSDLPLVTDIAGAPVSPAATFAPSGSTSASTTSMGGPRVRGAHPSDSARADAEDGYSKISSDEMPLNQGDVSSFLCVYSHRQFVASFFVHFLMIHWFLHHTRRWLGTQPTSTSTPTSSSTSPVPYLTSAGFRERSSLCIRWASRSTVSPHSATNLRSPPPRLQDPPLEQEQQEQRQERAPPPPPRPRRCRL